MRKALSVILSIAMLFSAFIMPSFALTYGDYSYEVVDGEAVITSYNGNAVTLTVPAAIDNIPVVKINDNAFKNNSRITSITLSEGIKDIGNSAFENCTSLSSISLPKTLVHFGKNAIFNTAYYNNEKNWKIKKTDTSVGDITIGSGNQDTVAWEDILAPKLRYLYLGTVLVELEFSGVYNVKNGTTVIADNACVNSPDAKNVNFPASLTAIGDYAFANCVSVKEFKISSNVKFSAASIYNTGFYNDENNWNNDVLYLDNRVVTTRNSGEAVISDGATEIISGAVNSENAVIPASVTSIADDAFVTDKVTIFGYGNSFAEEFADKNNIPFVNLSDILKGDVNFNGKLGKDDYEILSSVSLLKKENTYLISLAGDMNEDNAIDGFDVVILDLILNDIGPSTIKGDADGNGVVNELDYELLVKISSLQAEVENNYMFRRCDINEDGAVDSYDAVYLDLALNGLTAII